MPTLLTAEELSALRAINTPTISNAIELFNVRPRNRGFMSPEIRCIFPEFGVMVGYAVTSQIRAAQPAEPGRPTIEAYWKSVGAVPEPRVAVVQDLDDPPGVGAFFGEVNSNAHRALGFVGLVTDGSLRDLDEMRGVSFAAFALTPSVSRAYVHLESFGSPVTVGGVEVRPGDFIHADQHGVIVIPDECLKQVARAARDADAAEREFIDYCKSSARTLAGMEQAAATLGQRMAEVRKKYAMK
jgi:regulator of RNase E activity RraA